jgi:hypothetical protein
MSIAHSQHRYVYWCANCEIALHEREADIEIVLHGTYTRRVCRCAACKCTLDLYKFQDDEVRNEVHA